MTTRAGSAGFTCKTSVERGPAADFYTLTRSRQTKELIQASVSTDKTASLAKKVGTSIGMKVNKINHQDLEK